MKSLSLNTSAKDLSSTIEKLKVIEPQLLIVVGATDVLKDGSLVKSLSQGLPKAQIIGCSTSGEISNHGVSDEGLMIAAAHFDKSTTRTVGFELASADESRNTGIKLANALIAPDLKGVFVVAPGLNINGSQLVAGIREVLPDDVTLTGGLAGDGTRFQETCTILGGDVSATRVVAVGFYGKSIFFGAGSKGGWRPFGPGRRVTKAQGNILYEIDGKPALELYKEYLGARAADLPASGLLYPFAILNSNHSTTGLIRTILNVDHAANALILAGDIPVGSMVCLMHTDTDGLVGGSSEAARDAVADMPRVDDTLSICVSCVGRRLVMGENVDEEIEAAQDILGKTTHMIGFYSYGEIAPFLETGKPELHNQTMTITHIGERAA
jgi:hypothetical protein